MKARRRGVVAIVLALLSVPLLLAAYEAISFHEVNRSNGAFVSSGVKREYLLFVPRSYDRNRATPLVISMHGAAGWPVLQMQVSGWNTAAERDGFLVVYPSAVDGFGPRIWHVERGADLDRDVKFVAELIDTLQTNYNIDRSRIYADGLSNGGGMAFVLSCTLADRIAAFGMVAAAQTLAWSWCPDHTPVPAVVFHGTSDPDIPYEGGKSWMAPGIFPSVERWTKNWALRNGCDSTSLRWPIAPDVVRIGYSHCPADAPVVLYSIEGGGHTWPGHDMLPEWWVGPTTESIDATELMWSFFQRHPHRKKNSGDGIFSVPAIILSSLLTYCWHLANGLSGFALSTTTRWSRLPTFSAIS